MQIQPVLVHLLFYSLKIDLKGTVRNKYDGDDSLLEI